MTVLRERWWEDKVYCGLNRSRNRLLLCTLGPAAKKIALLIINRVIVRAVIKAVLINYRQ